jgi:NADH:ubiquinone oxidoreductase subunit H
MMTLFLITFFSLSISLLSLLLFSFCLLRSTINRMRFDELMTNGWIILLPIVWSLLLYSISIL